MREIAGMPLVKYVYTRCRHASCPKVMVATSIDESDDVLYGYCTRENIPVFRGDTNNVLARYIAAAEFIKAEYVSRVSGDTPLVDTHLIDRSLDTLSQGECDYVAVSRSRCASAFYSEAVTLTALKKVASLTRAAPDLEHVTKFIIENPKLFSFNLLEASLNPEFVRKKRLTIDFPNDIDTVTSLLKMLDDPFNYTSTDILSLIRTLP